MQSKLDGNAGHAHVVQEHLATLIAELHAVDVRALAQAPDEALERILGCIESLRASATQLRTRIKALRKDHKQEVASDAGTSAGFERSFGGGLRSANPKGSPSTKGTWGRKVNSRKAESRAAKAEFADQIASLQRESAAQKASEVAWALDILGASPTSHAHEIKALYRYMIRKTHPDALSSEVPPSGPSFADVQNAWEVLVSSGRAQ